MSADNYIVIRKHPDGGFANVMGFASDNRGEAKHSDTRYETYAQAMRAAHDSDTEYGVSTHHECRTERCPTCGHPLGA